MDTTLTLIRHGVTPWNLLRRAQGHAPVPLDSRGTSQVQRLAQRMASDRTITALYSSDLLRCCQTAAPIAERLNLPVVNEQRFREIDLGNWQGMSWDEWRAFDPDYFAHYAADPYNRPYPGGESRRGLAQRVLDGLRDVLARHQGEHVVIVTHGGPVRAVLRYFDLWPYTPFSADAPNVSNTSRTVLNVNADGIHADVLNLLDVSHLPAGLVT